MIEFALGVVAGAVAVFAFAIWCFKEEEILVSLPTDADYEDRVEAVLLTAGILNVPITLDIPEEITHEVPEQAS